MSQRAPLSGAVLAGGLSTRMGRDKALLRIDGVTFVDRVATTLAVRCGEVIVVLGDASHIEITGWRVVEDICKRCGPLGGIHAALTHAGHDAVFIASCDTPLLSVDVIDAILNHTGNARAVVAAVGERVHPLCGVYHRSCLPSIERALRDQRLAVREWLIEIGAASVDMTSLPGGAQALRNINDPGDYERLTTGTAPSDSHPTG